MAAALTVGAFCIALGPLGALVGLFLLSILGFCWWCIGHFLAGYEGED